MLQAKAKAKPVTLKKVNCTEQLFTSGSPVTFRRQIIVVIFIIKAVCYNLLKGLGHAILGNFV